MSVPDVKCPTCGFEGSCCFDQLRNDFFPYGIWHPSRIKEANSVKRAQLIMLEREIAKPSPSWRTK